MKLEQSNGRWLYSEGTNGPTEGLPTLERKREETFGRRPCIHSEPFSRLPGCSFGLGAWKTRSRRRSAVSASTASAVQYA